MRVEVRRRPKAVSQPPPAAKPSGVQSKFVKAARAHLKQTIKARDSAAQGGNQSAVKKLDRHIAMVTARIQSSTNPKQ
jgi:hypothetical protein